jgi:hypothetical protein
VNHDFGPTLAGDFANRVYPALTLIDAATGTYNQAGDASTRLHHELSDDAEPAEYGSIGDPAAFSDGRTALLGATGSPTLGGAADFLVTGLNAGDTAQLLIGTHEVHTLTAFGVRRVVPRFSFDITSGAKSINVPNNAALDGLRFVAQVLITDGITAEQRYSNGLRLRLASNGVDPGALGHRPAHPHRVRFNAAGDHLLLLNRGSEDVFLYSVQGNLLTLRAVYPPRIGFTERSSMDPTTATGDLPLGFTLHEDPTTNRARIHIINEVNRTLSTLEVDFTTGAIVKAHDQIHTLRTPDEVSFSARLGLEIFEDASRAQTTGAFNNSCASCHFEGGEDANVWQRPAGPRSTMPVYGGTLGTGLILWKGVRLHMGETGPMFGGENGGHGILSDAEQQGLIDYHEEIPFPLNPNLDSAGDLSPLAQLGRDLFFGFDDTGLNPTLRHAGCAECHITVETDPGGLPGLRLYTADFINPLITQQPDLDLYDPECFSLRENIVQINIRDVNTGANIDLDNDGNPDPDRNLDGFSDIETYAIQNADAEDGFRRDDPNGWLCPCDPVTDPTCDPLNPFRRFGREATHFSIPTKLGVFGTAPYFHDHGPLSLRALLDPELQTSSDPTYGDAAYSDGISRAGLMKNFNEFHDVRGHEQFVPLISKVQQDLMSTNVDADIEALLAFIESL